MELSSDNTSTKHPEDDRPTKKPRAEETSEADEMRESSIRTYKTIAKYLKKSVRSVILPEKYGTFDSTHGKEGDIEMTYPALVLDGASGTGKTQQAFALLQSGKQVVYLVMANRPPFQTEQEIYSEMRDFTAMDDLLEKLKAAVQFYVKEEEKVKGDLLSVIELQYVLSDAMSEHETRKKRVPKEIHDLITAMKDNVLSVDKDGKLVKTKVKKLEEVVLFVDEVLPRNEVGLSRFTRNFGRALGMRVVLAGTGATIANNMVKSQYGDVAGHSHSRRGAAERGWAECEFLWRPPTEGDLRTMFPDKKDNKEASMRDEGSIAAVSNPFTDENGGLRSVFEELKHERPLVACYVSEAYRSHVLGELNLTTLLTELGIYLQHSKGIKETSMMIWRTGAWLQRKSITASPFRLQPADLVKGHFFEPAISATSGERPYAGRGFVDIYPVTSPLRVYINRTSFGGEDEGWSICLSQETNKARPELFESETASVTESLDGVAYTMSHCVQQCLAREPLLAVALSTCHCDTNFRKISDKAKKIWKESSVPHSVGSVDGELHELMSFLAIQHACYTTNFPETNTVEEFIKNLVQIFQVPLAVTKRLRSAWSELWIKQPNHYDYEGFDIQNISKKRPENPPNAKAKKDVHETNRAKRYQTNFQEGTAEQLMEATKMPWLVPACSHPLLKQKIDASTDLFQDLNIAGLVPGEEHKAPFDARAVPWKKGAPVEWLFEFQAPSWSYSAVAARDDLETKIKKEEKEQKAVSHAMLMAAKGEGSTECYVWYDNDLLEPDPPNDTTGTDAGDAGKSQDSSAQTNGAGGNDAGESQTLPAQTNGAGGNDAGESQTLPAQTNGAGGNDAGESQTLPAHGTEKRKKENKLRILLLIRV